MKQMRSIEQTLENLETLHLELSEGGLDQNLAEKAGYSAVDVARTATEEAYQELHQKADFALGLKGQEIYGISFDQARVYLRQGLEAPPKKQSPEERAMLAIAKLMGMLREKPNSFVLALQAKEVAILLLGPSRLGGVYAEWQASTLGVGLFDWSEIQRLNQRIIGLVRALDPRQARRDAERFDLPLASFIEVGCYKNIAVACFRAVADQEGLGDIPAKQVLDIGSEALQKIDHDVAINPEQFEEYKVASVYARERALLDDFGKEDQKRFWERLTSAKAREIVQDIQDREISSRLSELVVRSARSAGIEC